MKATTRGGEAGALPSKKATKKQKAAARGFMCGCGGSKSVSTLSCAAAANISAPAAAAATPTKKTTAAAAKPAAEAKATAVPGCRDAGEDEAEAAAEGATSVDSLLQQLRELEQGVRALGVREQREVDGDVGDAPLRTQTRPRHRRSATEWGGRVEAESVAVVTESADPLGDFRRSMVQMIVENGITGGAELRELLQRFLSLNSPRHHHLILRAFADVWEELFAAGGRAPPPHPAAAAEILCYHSSRTSKRPCIQSR